VIAESEFRAIAASLDRSQLWGPDDTRGALNFLEPATVRAAISSVEMGEVVSCADPGLTTRAAIRTRSDHGDAWLAVNETVTFEQHGPHSMTHFDSLGHFFYDGRGHAGAEPRILTPTGVSALDVRAAASGIVGRGLLLDLPAVAGVPYIEPGRHIAISEVLAWLKRTSTTPDRGDVLFIRMGRPLAPDPLPGGYPALGGLDLDCARWIHDECFSLVVTDCGLDSPEPVVEGVVTPWHVLALTRMGVSLVDFAHLERLSDVCGNADRYTFLAVVSVLPLAGSTASPVNPLAVF
jgi:hypothetical protein